MEITLKDMSIQTNRGAISYYGKKEYETPLVINENPNTDVLSKLNFEDINSPIFD